MFTWLKKRLGSWVSTEPYDLYHPRERVIYSYWNGQQVVKADPMIIYKKLMEVGPELDIDIRVARSASKDATKAHESMIGKIRNIFSVKPLTDRGLTEAETVDLLDHFMLFNEIIKKKLNPSPTLAANSAVSGPSSADPPTIESGTASGCVAEESSTSSPEPSPTASPLPSA